jgi:hypothetical protein
VAVLLSPWYFWHISQGVCSEALIRNGRERLANLLFNYECFWSPALVKVVGLKRYLRLLFIDGSWCRTGQGREYTLPWFVQREG